MGGQCFAIAHLQLAWFAVGIRPKANQEVNDLQNETAAGEKFKEVSDLLNETAAGEKFKEVSDLQNETAAGEKFKAWSLRPKTPEELEPSREVAAADPNAWHGSMLTKKEVYAWRDSISFDDIKGKYNMGNDASSPDYLWRRLSEGTPFQNEE